MARLIDADALEQTFRRWLAAKDYNEAERNIIRAAIIECQDAPTVQPDAPRVMTLEEATNAECVFYEWRTRGVRPAKVIRVPYKTGTYRIQRFGDIDEWVHADEYGEYWRCWTALPTEEQRRAIDAQREAVKWE